MAVKLGKGTATVKKNYGAAKAQTTGRSFADGSATDYNPKGIGSVLNLQSGEY